MNALIPLRRRADKLRVTIIGKFHTTSPLIQYPGTLIMNCFIGNYEKSMVEIFGISADCMAEPLKPSKGRFGSSLRYGCDANLVMQTHTTTLHFYYKKYYAKIQKRQNEPNSLKL